MNDKKNICKFDDYVEPKSLASHNANPLCKSMSEFKLDKIYPRNINLKLNLDCKENQQEGQYVPRGGLHTRPNNDNAKFYHEYLNLKDQQAKNSIRRNKIAHIFNIRSINLVEKTKQAEDKQEGERARSRPKYQSNKRNHTEKIDKDSLKTLNLVIPDKKGSPDHNHKKHLTENRSGGYFQKFVDNKPMSIQKNPDCF